MTEPVIVLRRHPDALRPQPIPTDPSELGEAARAVVAVEQAAVAGAELGAIEVEQVEVAIAVGPSIDGTNELVDELSRADARIRVIANPVGSTPAGLSVRPASDSVTSAMATSLPAR